MKEDFESPTYNRVTQRLWLTAGAGTFTMAATFLVAEAVRLGTGSSNLPPTGFDVESIRTLLTNRTVLYILGETALATAGMYQMISAHTELTADAIARRNRQSLKG